MYRNHLSLCSRCHLYLCSFRAAHLVCTGKDPRGSDPFSPQLVVSLSYRRPPVFAPEAGILIWMVSALHVCHAGPKDRRHHHIRLACVRLLILVVLNRTLHFRSRNRARTTRRWTCTLSPSSSGRCRRSRSRSTAWAATDSSRR